MTDLVALRQSIAGVHNYMPTPFLSDFSLDLDGMRNNVAFHADDFHQDMIITVGAVYGEGDTLDLEEHKDCVSAAVDGAQGKIHINAGVVGGYGMQKRMARNAEEAGADSLIVFSPFRPNQDHVKEEMVYSYIKELSETVSIGIIVFPMSDSKIWSTILEKVAVLKNVVGFLPANNDIGNRVNSLVPDRYVWLAENEDNAIRSFPHGCRAYTTAVSSLVPKASYDFWKCGIDGDEDKMMKVFKRDIEPILKIRQVKNGGISGIKIALEMLGRSGGTLRPPRTPVNQSDVDIIRGILSSHPEVRDLLT